MASEFSDVDKSIVIAGGVMAANLPHEARNFRRSSSAFSGRGSVISSPFHVTLGVRPTVIIYTGIIKYVDLILSSALFL
jgi:hypothetical protein